MELLDTASSLPLFRNSALDWLIAITIIILLLVVLFSLRRLIRRYHDRLRRTEGTEIAEIPTEVLSRTTTLFFVVLSVYGGLQTLTMTSKTALVLDSVITVALFWQAGVWAAAATKGMLERRRRRSLAHDRAAQDPSRSLRSSRRC